MHPGVGRFAQHIELGHIGTTGQIRHHPTAGVVGRRHHGDGFAGDVDAQFGAARQDIGKVLVQGSPRFQCNK